MSAIAERLTAALVAEGAIETRGEGRELEITSTATFSPDTRGPHGQPLYRYSLSRTWTSAPPVVFVMLNPSTADAFKVDPTVSRCIRYARDWGAGGVIVLNIFALRSTDPKGLYDADIDPIGLLADAAFMSLPRDEPMATPIVCAWGAHGGLMDRGPTVAGLLIARGFDVAALHVTKNGHPGHPLYLKGDLTPTAYPVGDRA